MQLEGDLVSLEQFREKRNAYSAQTDELTARLAAADERQAEALMEQERRFLRDKSAEKKVRQCAGTR